jgi:phosphatidylinositol alpha-mannosyltransferase
MRIALVAEDYYPQLGGVPEHVHNLALQLIKWGHSVTVVTSLMRGAGPDPSFVRRVGRSRVVYANGGIARITTGWRLRQRLEELFRAGRYDVVHVHGGLAPTMGIVAPQAAWRLGIPVVATFHSWFPTSPSYRVLHHPLQRLLDRHAATIAVSPPVAQLMSRYFEADWELIPNGVDVEFFRPDAPRPQRTVAGEPSLLFLGRIEPRNGLGTVLRAMPRVLRRYPRTQLTVVGDGPWLGYYRWRAQPLGLAVTFVGRVLRERPGYYASADLYLCPTRIASFGVTLLEAMACGTPMVVADNAGFRALVGTGAEAVFLPPYDDAMWAETVIELLGAPAQRQVMSQAGIAKAADFAWPLIAQQELAVYERVAGLVPEGVSTGLERAHPRARDAMNGRTANG